MIEFAVNIKLFFFRQHSRRGAVMEIRPASEGPSRRASSNPKKEGKEGRDNPRTVSEGLFSPQLNQNSISVPPPPGLDSPSGPRCLPVMQLRSISFSQE